MGKGGYGFEDRQKKREWPKQDEKETSSASWVHAFLGQKAGAGSIRKFWRYRFYLKAKFPKRVKVMSGIVSGIVSRIVGRIVNRIVSNRNGNILCGCSKCDNCPQEDVN